MTWTKERHEAVKVRCETPNVHGWGDLPDALAEIERLTAKASVCEWQHRPCVDCGAMGTFVGQGLYECWKCTAVELRAERDSARAELHSCGMELQTCRATLEEERRDGDAQRAEIERLTDERIEIDRTLDEAGVMVASGETTCSRVARMIADANMESERTLTAEKEAERLTAELAGQSKATLTWRDTAERHLARAKVAERDLAALRTAYEATLAPGDISVSRAILERLAKAAESDSDAREARWAAERILQQAPLAAEPARTDPEAARRLAESQSPDPFRWIGVTEIFFSQLPPPPTAREGREAFLRILRTHRECGHIKDAATVLDYLSAAVEAEEKKS